MTAHVLYHLKHTCDISHLAYKKYWTGNSLSRSQYLLLKIKQIHFEKKERKKKMLEEEEEEEEEDICHLHVTGSLTQV